MKREVWLDFLRVVVVGAAAVLLQRIPKVGKCIIG